MRLGLHLSVRQGPRAALDRALDLGLEALQILPYRRRPGEGGDFRWEKPDPVQARELSAAAARGAVGRLAVHSRYVPFLASTDPESRRRSRELLARELGFARDLGGKEFVLHLGAYSPGSDPREGTRIFAEGVAEAYAGVPDAPRLVMENVPGGGRRMGGRLEDLAALRTELAARGVASNVCLDTAHAWAAGYDVASAAGMDAFLDAAGALFGAPAVTLFHLNDTQAEPGSNREHHEHWGLGRLGDAGLKRLLTRPDYAHAAGILEMPPGRDEANLAYVRAVRKG